jgi:hypothetical protein
MLPYGRVEPMVKGSGHWPPARSMIPAAKVSVDPSSRKSASILETGCPQPSPEPCLQPLVNLAIPENLKKQDYWYRVEFHAPRSKDGG